jgi:protease-4
MHIFRIIKFIFSSIKSVFDFVQNYFKTVVFITILIMITSQGEEKSFEKANLYRLELNGAIMDSKKFLEDIEKAKKSNIKGVLLVVNSPGGAVAPSVEMSYAIKELNDIKPVVAYASGTMASGSYYASIWAKEIVANPGSMIGSIGVIFQSMNAKELISKIGLKPQTVKAGKYKEAGTPFRDWKNYEKAELNNLIKDTYDMFITDVADARDLNKTNHTKYADAHVFTARGAKKVGLVDEVGTINIAINRLQKLSKIKKPIWNKKDKFETMMENLANQGASSFINMLSSSNGLQSSI